MGDPPWRYLRASADHSVTFADTGEGRRRNHRSEAVVLIGTTRRAASILGWRRLAIGTGMLIDRQRLNLANADVASPSVKVNIA